MAAGVGNRVTGWMPPPEAVEVLDFWFGPGWRDGEVEEDADREAMWWQGAPAVDERIRARFTERHGQAFAGGLDHWAATPAGRLALILVLDQFSRQIHRDQPDAFAGDAPARRFCLEGLERGDDQALGPLQRLFFYMPLEHAEDFALQARSVALFETLLEAAPADQAARFRRYLDFAVSHQAVVDRFGRFPHRNAVLGRESSPAERDFLATRGRGF